jgi:hypothetical protein
MRYPLMWEYLRGYAPRIKTTYPQIGGKMALSDTNIRSTKPAGKPYKLADGGGLYP